MHVYTEVGGSSYYTITVYVYPHATFEYNDQDATEYYYYEYDGDVDWSPMHTNQIYTNGTLYSTPNDEGELMTWAWADLATTASNVLPKNREYCNCSSDGVTVDFLEEISK